MQDHQEAAELGSEWLIPPPTLTARHSKPTSIVRYLMSTH